MSATSTLSNPEPPPLLFSPPFSPRSPPHIAMEEPEDVDMTTSTTLPAQNHDRLDNAIQESGEGGEAASVQESEGSRSSPGSPHDQSDDGDNDTPMPDSALPAEAPPETSQPQSHLPHPTTTIGDLPPQVVEQDNNPPAANNPTNENTSADQNNGAEQDGGAPGSSADQSSQANPPNPTTPPNNPTSQSNMENRDNRDDDSSMSDDDEMLRWRDVPEDTSAPDEEELEQMKKFDSHSASDDSYWRNKTFRPLNDPEYTPGTDGILVWEIDGLNGTKENPNKALVMESKPAKIGNHNWRIKLYPNGTDNDGHFSVFLTCADMEMHRKRTSSLASKSSSSSQRRRNRSSDGSDNTIVAATEEQEQEQGKAESEESEPPAEEWQHTPLPLIEPKRIAKRPSVAAQFTLVMYNPAEPRVHESKFYSHRFSPGDPDRGSKRWSGLYDVAVRQRFQYQALYRNDKIAFKAYIRLVNDDTGCLWESTTRSNPYDSLAMTGLQGISAAQWGLYGGNLVALFANLMLLKPFRKLLYEAVAPNPFLAVERPKPMLLAFQEILYSLRTRPNTVSEGPVSLTDLLDGTEWYSLDKNLEKYDVVQLWRMFRTLLQTELEDTPYAGRLDEIFGRKADFGGEAPTYKIPVRGVKTVQEAIDRTPGFVEGDRELPQVLNVELDRWGFDDKERAWEKRMDKVKMDDKINVRGTQYTLYAFAAHEAQPQSGYYHSVVRPGGPNGKWYKYTDGRENYKVKCIPKAAAVVHHEGPPEGADKYTKDNWAVAYYVTYVRDDIADWVFDSEDEPEWKVPEWLAEDVQRQRERERTLAEEDWSMSQPADLAMNFDGASDDGEANAEAAAKEYEFTVFTAECFKGWEGPGFLDIWDPKWQDSPLVFKVSLRGDMKLREVQGVIAKYLPGVKDPRQVKVMTLSTIKGYKHCPLREWAFPSASSESHWTIRHLVKDEPESRLWVHAIPVEDLPPLPAAKEPEAANNAKTEPAAPTTISGNDNSASSSTSQPEATSTSQLQSEDHPMGGTDEATMTNNFVDPTTTAAIINLPPFGHPDGGLHLPADTTHPNNVFNGLPVPPPGNPLILTGVPFPGSAIPPEPANEINVTYKLFDVGTQSVSELEIASVKNNKRLDTVLIDTLGEDKAGSSWMAHLELDATNIRTLRIDKSLRDNQVNADNCTIILQQKLDEQQNLAEFEAGKFTDLGDFLKAKAWETNFPGDANTSTKLQHYGIEYYAGDLKSNLPHGHGVKVYHDKTSYRGDFVLGQRHGQGTFRKANGDRYTGAWVMNRQNGQGELLEADTGNKFVGNFRDGDQYGEGVTYWKKAHGKVKNCAVCWIEKVEVVFNDCGHMVTCQECGRQCPDCPVCRKSVKSVIKVYTS